jgi:hypothetical protein
MLTKDSIISHLGKNPKKGGNPPRDKSERNKINLITVLLLNITNICLIWYNLKLLNKNTIVKDKNE